MAFVSDIKWILLGVRSFWRTATAQSPDRAAPPEEGDLPRSWEADGATLLAVSPHRVYVYWSGPGLGAGKAILRLCDAAEKPLTGAVGPGFSEVEVDLAAGNWYVDLWEPASAYRAELGFREGETGWTVLARTNAVEMPRSHPAPHAGASPDPALPDRGSSVTAHPLLDSRGSVAVSEPQPSGSADRSPEVSGRTPPADLPRLEPQPRQMSLFEEPGPDLAALGEERFIPGVSSAAPER